MLKLITIRRQGTIAVLGRNLAVRVLMEKTARLESPDTAINDVDHEGTAPENQVHPKEGGVADFPIGRDQQVISANGSATT
jgi:hypothetical protein